MESQKDPNIQHNLEENGSVCEFCESNIQNEVKTFYETNQCI